MPLSAHRRRTVGAAATAAAAALMTWGAFGAGWWSSGAGKQRFDVGLRAMRICTANGCRSTPLANFGGSLEWARVGHATFAAGVVTAVLLALAAVLTVAWRRAGVGDLLCRMSAAGAVFSGALAVGFVAAHPSSLGLAPSYALAGFFAGSALGAFGGLVAARSE